jgi:hypothetical protein
MKTPQINDGGPAFPNIGYTIDKNYNGMTLRDWFAGQALAGLLTQSVDAAEPEFPLIFASAAYEVADAMIKAREVKL